MLMDSVITCPNCGIAKKETMPMSSSLGRAS